MQSHSSPLVHPTPRQLQILRQIAEALASSGYSPTISELSKTVGISRSTAFEHIAELQKKGLLIKTTAKARSLRPTLLAEELLDSLDRHNQSSNQPLSLSSGSSDIPLKGRVAAGVPIEAVEQNRFITVDSCFGSSDQIFALEVTGDSMIEDGIFDGDYVICRNRKTADNGQLVIASVDNGEVTLKRFYKESTRVRLQPANSSYAPIYSNNCQIEAIVVGLLRKF